MKSWRGSQSLVTAPAAVVVGGVIFYFHFYLFIYFFGDRFFIEVLPADFSCFKFLIVEESHTFHIKKNNNNK